MGLQSVYGVEVVSACYLNVLLLLIKQHGLDTDILNVAKFLEIRMMWVGTLLSTPEFLHEFV